MKKAPKLGLFLCPYTKVLSPAGVRSCGAFCALCGAFLGACNLATAATTIALPNRTALTELAIEPTDLIGFLHLTT